jgi:hypothetical protein
MEIIWLDQHTENEASVRVCGVDTESIKHTVTECTMARLFWQKTKESTGVKLPRLHPYTWASDVMKEDFCLEADRSVLIIGMYALWMQRNKHRHGAEQLPPEEIVQWTVDMAHALLHVFFCVAFQFWPRPMLFQARQPGQQPPQLILNRGGLCKKTVSINAY